MEMRVCCHIPLHITPNVSGNRSIAQIYYLYTSLPARSHTLARHPPAQCNDRTSTRALHSPHSHVWGRPAKPRAPCLRGTFAGSSGSSSTVCRRGEQHLHRARHRLHELGDLVHSCSSASARAHECGQAVASLPSAKGLSDGVRARRVRARVAARS
jgi:hypothetical protein